jgi:hypothetical protein
VVDYPGERDDSLLLDAIGERSEAFDNARRRLHQAMKRWDQLLPGKGTVLGKDETQIGGLVRIADEGEIEIPASSLILNTGLAKFSGAGIRA